MRVTDRGPGDASSAAPRLRRWRAAAYVVALTAVVAAVLDVDWLTFVLLGVGVGCLVAAHDDSRVGRRSARDPDLVPLLILSAAALIALWPPFWT